MIKQSLVDTISKLFSNSYFYAMVFCLSMTSAVTAGPLTGMCAAWVVRALGYTAGATTAAATVGVTTVASGGLAGAPTAATIMTTAPVYIATVEGLATSALILGYSCVFLP